MTTALLGPLATRILSDYGADVVKLETVDGDAMRANGAARHPGMGSVFLSVNRNKRSIAVDLKSNEGRFIGLQLATNVDVLVHNMRTTAIARLGLDYECVRAVNPGVVYCAATGFGRDGPYHGKPAYDDIIQAACGLADLVRRDTGVPNYPPMLLADKTAGMALVNAVLAALLHRQKSGQGQEVEVPMFETMVEFTMVEHLAGFTFDPPLSPAGYDRILSGARGPTRSSDGYVAILPDSPAKWAKLFGRVGRADLAFAYDFSDFDKLNATARDLYVELSRLTPEKSTGEWIAICEELDIAVAPIWAVDELQNHPHLEAVGLFEGMDHPTEGAIRFVRPAVRFAATPVDAAGAAPRLGEHSETLLAELGYGAEQIRSLVARRIVRLA